MKLATKMIGGNQLLFVLLAIVLGGLAVYSLSDLGKTILSDATESVEDLASNTLIEGTRNDSEVINYQIESTIRDVMQLSESENLRGYLTARHGKNKVWNDLAKTEVIRLVDDMVVNTEVQQQLRQQSVVRGLNVGRSIMADAGGIRLTEQTVQWDAINQYTKKATPINLPQMLVGETAIPKDNSFENMMPVVDKATNIMGGTFTIFQRMNDAGDMLRVATSVKKLDGTRAIGTYIPAINPNGKENPVIKTVMSGETFYGRAYVVNAWYITSYEPITDHAGKIIGILYAGVLESDNEQMQNMIANTKIGESGYPFVMNRAGVILNHPKESLIGKDVVKDLKLDLFKEVIEQCTDKEVRFLDYTFEDRKKFVAYKYVPHWDWIICGSGYYSDLTEKAASTAKNFAEMEFVSLAHVSTIKSDKGDIIGYSQVRFVNNDGKELIKIVNGEKSDTFVDHTNDEWFKITSKLPKESYYISDLHIATNTDNPEVRISIPIYDQNNTFEGVLALNMNWQMTVETLGKRVYGKTGYAFILNEKGVMVTHPKYSLKDNNSLADVNNGAEIVKIFDDKISKDQTGVAEYTFEGVQKLMAFRPSKIGDHTFYFIASIPREELYGAIDEMEASTHSTIKNTVLHLLIVSLVMLGVASLVNIIVSRGITRGIINMVDRLKDIAQGEGDLTRRVDESSRDELGEMGKWFNTFMDKIHDVISEVVKNTMQVASAANEIAASSDEMSSSMSTQTDQTLQVASAVEEMSSTVAEVANKSADASKTAQDAGTQAREGGQVVQDMIQEMRNISEVVNRTALSINGLGARGEEIGQIIGVINDIADQTNLLALNAAIEAARAGEHGRGFAVVADEVRKLAERTVQATEEVAKSITAIQTETSQAVEQMSEGTGRVNEGVTYAEKAGNALEAIVNGSKQVSNMIQSIAAASDEQATATHQISRSLDTINSVTRHSSEGAQQAACAATQLSEKSEQLRALVSQFKLREQGTAS
ncbi:MAG: Cache 3/Cache 2 fusion domain-containing protein [Phycisphaeraceae bacterium JB051]